MIPCNIFSHNNFLNMGICKITYFLNQNLKFLIMSKEEKILQILDKKAQKLEKAYQVKKSKRQKTILCQIKVIIRVRPPLKSEYGKEIVTEIDTDGKTVNVDYKEDISITKFDKAFD